MVGIELKKIAAPGQWRDFFRKVRHKNYAQFPEIPPTALTEIFFQELKKIATAEPVFFLARAGGRPAAFLSLGDLQWDTEHFGLSMGRIWHLLGGVDQARDLEAKTLLVKAALREFRRRGTVHLTARISGQDFHSGYALERAGFFLADTIAEWGFDYQRSRIPRGQDRIRVRLYQAGDLKQVKAQTRSVFQGYFDRFHRDPILDQKKSDALYQQWIINDCLGQAEAVALAFVKRELAGVLSMKTLDSVNRIAPIKLGEIPIVGVIPGFRGQGVFTALVNFAQRYFNGKLDTLNYATQINNLYVQRALSRLGFAPTGFLNTFHRHLQGE